MFWSPRSNLDNISGMDARCIPRAEDRKCMKTHNRIVAGGPLLL